VIAGELAGTHPGDCVIIGGPEGLLTSDDRVRGFQRGLARAGLPPAEVVRTGFDRAGGHDAGPGLAGRIGAGQAADSGVSRLCIFAVNDVMAIGGAAALRSEGLRIPRDAAIAGFDNIETLRDFRPALSTVRLPLEEIGRLAVLGTAAGGSTPDGGTTVPVTGQVTLRRSTEPVSEAAA
jgi:LacI family transcriptional regulator